MSYNLLPKTCASCGKRAEAMTPEAWRYVPMVLKRPVFGKPEQIYACTPSDNDCNCVMKAEAYGYVLRLDLIPKR